VGQLLVLVERRAGADGLGDDVQVLRLVPAPALAQAAGEGLLPDDLAPVGARSHHPVAAAAIRRDDGGASGGPVRRGLHWRSTDGDAEGQERRIEVTKERLRLVLAINRAERGDDRPAVLRVLPDPLQHADGEGGELGLSEPIGHGLDGQVAVGRDAVTKVDAV